MTRFVLPIFVISLCLFTSACFKQTAASDDSISTALKAKFFSEPDLKAANISVSVKGGEVTLTGDVPNAEAQLKAYKLANDQPGVTRINDQLRLAGVSSASRPPPFSGEVERPPAADSGLYEPVQITIPSGTRLVVRMIDSIDSSRNAAGQTFRASLEAPVIINGRTVAPAGSDITVRLAEARRAGKIKGRSELELQLSRLVVHGTSYPVVSNSYEQKGSSRGRQTARRVGIGAGIGAVIGAIAGGGKGAAIGAALGGGGAGAYQVLTKGQRVKIPSETVLQFTLQEPVTITAGSR